MRHEPVPPQRVKLRLLPTSLTDALKGKPEQTFKDRLLDWVRGHKLWLVIVALPTLCAAFYLYLIAADRYEVEATFVVRSESSSAAAQISSLITGGGITRSADDSYIAQAFMESRAAVAYLAEDFDLLKRLDAAEGDFLWRYSSPLNKDSREHLWKWFQHFIKVEYDSTTGITTLRVQAFTPEDAKEIADALLAKAETLINRLSDRSQADALQIARKELELSKERAAEELNRIKEWRQDNGVIDPTLSSKSALNTITSLALDVAETQAQLKQVQKISPNSPQTVTLQNRIKAFEDQIAKERATLAGRGDSLAKLFEEYDTLSLQKEFAQQSLMTAQTSYDLARIGGERRRLFLERISAPQLSDHPVYPKKFLDLGIVFGICLIIYIAVKKALAEGYSHDER